MATLVYFVAQKCRKLQRKVIKLISETFLQHFCNVFETFQCCNKSGFD